ncbi:YgaP family membrane protein [Halobellus litoreus]|uniref:DUF2892 domain-containing protein n=1 Tax=Halobellus litoreus TaxID=755310 RepID=A0ABD6DWF2_9EURY|nr:DUF2892 domain-containing protein [Halobellus litoreus]
MEQNVGRTDGIARVAIGAIAGVISLAILGNAVSGPAILSPILGIVSIMMLATGATGRCGVYSLIGVNTCKAR